MNAPVTRLELMRQLILRCQDSSQFFIENFCRVKHPKAGIIPFKLFKYQKKSLREFIKHRFNIYKKCRQCLDGETPVWTIIGPKFIRDLHPGDWVYSLDLETGQLKIVSVQQVHKNGRRCCVEVRTKTGHRAIVTTDHEYFTRRGWVQAADLTAEDVVIEVQEPQRYVTAAEQKEDAILLGYLITHGYYGSKSRQVHFTNTCWRYLLDFQRTYKRKFGTQLRVRPHNRTGKSRRKNAYRITSYEGSVKNWLRGLGIYGQIKKQKLLPKQVFFWGNEQIALLLNRMFAGDGWYSCSRVTNEVGIGSQSIQLLYQIKQLLSRFGINCQVYPKIKSGLAKLRILGGRDFALFIDRIGILGKSVRKPITKGFFFNKIRGQVKSVTPIGYREVYDISVPPYDNYVANGAIVHNSGISTLSGSFALWYGMFHAHKTILIVSKRDKDAKDFLQKNVKFVYDHLPKEFKAIWGDPPPTYNEHSVVFPNGSSIMSLTSSPNTLRSHSASLNIIDEAAYMPHMHAMWQAGGPVLQHGGSVIVISTCAGVGDWYQVTWEDAENGKNDFNPIVINWWDMDWQIEFVDDLTRERKIIAPTAGLRKCETKDEINKWGPYWSPWLEEQYRQLQQKGEAHKFRQEVLAEFLGSGNTVVTRETLIHLGERVVDNFSTVDQVPYIHPATGERLQLSFQNELYIWKKPVRAEPDVIEHGRVIKPGRPGHTYVMGVDIASGEADDYSAIEIIDITTKEQVAELNIKVLPRVLLFFVDYLGRWYNGAFCVPERTGIGIPVCQALYLDIGYYNIFRMLMPSGRRSKKIGYPTTDVYKPALNKCLMDMLGEEGIAVYSRRLWQQLSIYVHLTHKKTGHVEGPGNHSDLSIAMALALMGIREAVQSDSRSLVPMRQVPTDEDVIEPTMTSKDSLQEMVNLGGINALTPVIIGPKSDSQMILTPSEEIRKFAAQLGGTAIGAKNASPAFVRRKQVIQYPIAKQ